MFLADVYDGINHDFLLILAVFQGNFDFVELKFTIYPHHDLFIFKHAHLLLPDLEAAIFLPQLVRHDYQLLHDL